MALVEVYGGQRSLMFVNLNFSCIFSLLNITRKMTSEYV